MWLLEQSALNKMLKVEETCAMVHSDQLSAMSNDESNAHKVEGDTCVIPIKGVLTKDPDFWAWFFGGGNPNYGDIQSKISKAENDTKIKKIVLEIDSPGGEVHGLFELLNCIKNCDKPIHAEASMACSAAYAVAACCDSILAESEASFFGSVGVVVDSYISKNHVSVTSTKAPNKRHDLATEEGKSALRDELDSIHDLFAASIASGRGVTTEKVDSEYGKGATLLAKDAIKVGMIDSIKETKSKRKTETMVMDLAQLKTDHPSLYSKCVDIGKKQEKARVLAHLTMAEVSGDYACAIESINDDEDLNQLVEAKHKAAVLKANLASQRKDEADNQDHLNPKGEDDVDPSVQADEALMSALGDGLGINVEVSQL